MTKTLEGISSLWGKSLAYIMPAIIQQLCATTRNYRQITFIEMGIEPDDRFERKADMDAKSKGWAFEKIAGDLSLIRRFLDGDWSDDAFLVVPPGHRVATSHDALIIQLEPSRR